MNNSQNQSSRSHGKIANPIIAVVAFCVVAAGVGIFWYSRKHTPAVSKMAALQQSAKQMREQQSEAHLKVFNDPKASAKDKDAALLRLALIESPQGSEILLKQLSDKTAAAKATRDRAAQLLLYYTDPKIEKQIADLLKENDPELRVSILQNWHARRTPKRLLLLSDALKGVTLNTRERFYRNMAYLRLETDTKNISNLVGEILKDYKSVADSKQKAEIFRILISSQNHNPKVQDEALNVLRSMNATEPEVFIESIHSLKVFCPKDRYALIEKVIKTSKMPTNVKEAALFELAAHPGPEAMKILTEVQKNHLDRGTNPQAMSYLNSRLHQIKSGGSCANRKTL